MKWPSKLNSEAKAKWQLVSLKPGDFNYVSRLCSALGQHTDWLSPSYVHSVSELWVWTGSLFVLETPNSHRFKHISSFCFQEGFYLWLWCTFNSKMRSHKHTGNITSQVLICLFSITLFPFFSSVNSRKFWHVKGVFFEERVSQTFNSEMGHVSSPFSHYISLPSVFFVILWWKVNNSTTPNHSHTYQPTDTHLHTRSQQFKFTNWLGQPWSVSLSESNKNEWHCFRK